MARWAAFLAGTLPAPDVLDPASVLELRNTAMLQADGISAVSSGTLETAFSHGRWTHNKLGCLGGYRSATTLVPELGLSLFAAAASTCDFYGDGDAVGFPIVSRLIPPLEAVLASRFAESQRSPPPSSADIIGKYVCGYIADVHQEARLAESHVDSATPRRLLSGVSPFLPPAAAGSADASQVLTEVSRAADGKIVIASNGFGGYP